MGVHILTIDSERSLDPLIREIFRDEQGGVNYAFHAVASGDAACAYLNEKQNRVDIVLLDINVTGRLNGLDLLVEIIKIDITIKAILICAYADREHSRYAIQRGAFDLVLKPVEPDDLRFTIQRAAALVMEMRKAAQLLIEVETLRHFTNGDVAEFNKAKSISEFMQQCRREIGTVLVVNINGYTVISRTMPAEEIIKLLNGYFTEITRSVYAHNGEVDKFLGDRALAVFRGLDHLENAVAASLEIRNQIATMNKVREINNEEQFSAGMGLSSGEIIQGNIGSIDPVRLDHTYIGDSVNMGFRIQEIAGPNEILFLLNEHTECLLSIYTHKKYHAATIMEGGKNFDIYHLARM